MIWKTILCFLFGHPSYYWPMHGTVRCKRCMAVVRSAWD